MYARINNLRGTGDYRTSLDIMLDNYAEQKAKNARALALKESFSAVTKAIYHNVFNSNKAQFDAWVDGTDLIPDKFSWYDEDFATAIIEELKKYLDDNTQKELIF